MLRNPMKYRSSGTSWPKPRMWWVICKCFSVFTKPRLSLTSPQRELEAFHLSCVLPWLPSKALSRLTSWFTQMSPHPQVGFWGLAAVTASIAVSQQIIRDRSYFVVSCVALLALLLCSQQQQQMGVHKTKHSVTFCSHLHWSKSRLISL